MNEENEMTNKEAAALIEAIKIIVDRAKDKEEIKKALGAIQSQLSDK